MNNVINLNDKKGAEKGEAICNNCGREWFAIVPFKNPHSIWLECPSCRLRHGKLKFSFLKNPSTLVWNCGCGNELFFYTTKGIVCSNCEALTPFDDISKE